MSKHLTFMMLRALTANKRNCLTKLYVDNKVIYLQYASVCKTLGVMPAKPTTKLKPIEKELFFVYCNQI